MVHLLADAIGTAAITAYVESAIRALQTQKGRMRLEPLPFTAIFEQLIFLSEHGSHPPSANPP